MSGIESGTARTEYRVVCGDGVDWHDMAALGVAQGAWVSKADLFGCGPHHLKQRTIHETPWLRADTALVVPEWPRCAACSGVGLTTCPRIDCCEPHAACRECAGSGRAA